MVWMLIFDRFSKCKFYPWIRKPDLWEWFFSEDWRSMSGCHRLVSDCPTNSIFIDKSQFYSYRCKNSYNYLTSILLMMLALWNIALFSYKSLRLAFAWVFNNDLGVAVVVGGCCRIFDCNFKNHMNGKFGLLPVLPTIWKKIIQQLLKIWNIII